MAYIPPGEVISPKAHWHLFDVVLDTGEGGCAYALGTWDGERRVGFRWNGSEASGRIGNPQSRGLPTWTMLDPALHPAVAGLLPSEKQVLARRFLGLRPPSEWLSILSDIRNLHQDRIAKIAGGMPIIPTSGEGSLVLHIVPLSAVGAGSPLSSESLFRSPDRFPPMGRPRPQGSRVDQTGLLTGSNSEGLGKAQGAYVHVSRAGVIEAVAASMGAGVSKNIELKRICDYLVKYTRIYAAGLNASGVEPPYAIFVSLVGVKDMRLLENLVPNAYPEDLPSTMLADDIIEFGEIVLELVPGDIDNSAKVLRPLLNHIANAAGFASSPYFDADGNYSLKRQESL